MRQLLVITLLAAAACARVRPETQLPPLPFATDTVRSQRVSDGVVRRYIHSSAGPWAISVLEIDLGRCNRAVAVKGGESPAGRTKTTTLLDELSKREHVVGGVNADFFSLADGTPVGLLVVNSRMVTPPAAQPALGFDSAGMPHIDVFRRRGMTLLPFHPLEAVSRATESVSFSPSSTDVRSRTATACRYARRRRSCWRWARARRSISTVADRARSSLPIPTRRARSFSGTAPCAESAPRHSDCVARVAMHTEAHHGATRP